MDGIGVTWFGALVFLKTAIPQRPVVPGVSADARSTNGTRRESDARHTLRIVAAVSSGG